AERSNWMLLNDRFPHADDQAFGQAYLDLYLEDKKPVRMADTKAIMDRLIVRPDDPDKLLWWWCDALFMSPPVLLRLYEITHDKKYLDYMDHEWWLTSASLYNQENHLYFRDSRYFTQKQANGKPIFWSRGNGWVMGGLVRMLDNMPEDYPDRKRFEDLYRRMAAKIVTLQNADGTWHAALLDPQSYPVKEASGTGFYCYALAYGINHGLLSYKKYHESVEKAWNALVGCMQTNGKLGYVQQIGEKPEKVTADDTETYGVGAFLLAGSEVYRMLQKHK
ncbi:MAG TPA: glycoside hydrolase family 88 protein, partial [Mucilaginibacter sp.]|nr:glycoside hydrolase family 88 protein [Mucilaginibacter sp.]